MAWYVETIQLASNNLNPSFHIHLKIVYNINVDTFYVTERNID